jgi:membrane protease YdiL (CAAX protease family)
MGAAVITSVMFGVVHGYQGVLGVLRTGVMGGVLAWGFISSGSLWPVMIAHTLIDLIAGIVLGERLLSPESGTGVGRGS